MMHLRPAHIASISLSVAISLLSAGCSLRAIAVNKLGDALAREGEVFSSDDDPELVRREFTDELNCDLRALLTIRPIRG